MRPSRFTIILAIALATSACGAAAVIQERQAENAQAEAVIRPLMARAQEQCAAEWRSPQLDPIRNKVIFNYNEPVPLPLLVISDKPTPTEREALLAWGSARERCARFWHATFATMPLPPSMNPDLKERARAGLSGFVDQTLQGGNFLTASLYTDQISFGEFNRQRSELQSRLNAQQTAWLSVLDAQDNAATMQKALAAQQQADAAVAILGAAASAACASSKNRAVEAMCQ